MSQRWRPVVYSAVAVCGIWLVALAGYRIARNAKMTAEKVKAYAETVDISKLSGSARAKAIRELEDMLNALSLEERRKARLGTPGVELVRPDDRGGEGGVLEATMPTGFKQMLTSFEQLPEEKRRRAIDDAMRRLKEQRGQMGAGLGGGNSWRDERTARAEPGTAGTNEDHRAENLLQPEFGADQSGAGAGAGRVAARDGKRPAVPQPMRTEMRNGWGQVRSPKSEVRRKAESRDRTEAARSCRGGALGTDEGYERL